MELQHRVPVELRSTLGDFPADEAGWVPTNMYASPNYVVLDIAFPQCLPQHIRVVAAPDALLVEAERHPGADQTDEGRQYLLHELPLGPIRRLYRLPDA